MPSGGVGAVLVEPDDGSCLPQNLVRGMRVAQEIKRERIERACRNPGGRPARGGELLHGGVSPEGLVWRRRYSLIRGARNRRAAAPSPQCGRDRQRRAGRRDYPHPALRATFSQREKGGAPSPSGRGLG